MSERASRWLRGCAAAAIMAGAATATTAAPAFASHGITVTATTAIRTGPSSSSTSVGSVPAGTSPSYLCWTTGQSVGGVNVWFDVFYSGYTGFIASYYDNSTYTHDGDITAKYDIQPCHENGSGIKTTAAVTIKSGPDSGFGSTGSVPNGVSPTKFCWLPGQKIGYVDVWFDVTYGGNVGFIPSYYDDSSYTHDGDITAKYGIPECATAISPPTSPVSATEAAAANWATGQIGSKSWDGLCLALVNKAWAAAGVSLPSEVSVAWNGNTYPTDIWGHFKAGKTGTGAPAVPGSIVFFHGSTSAHYRDWSHVIIYVGNGEYVSSPDSVNESDVHYETYGQHPTNVELGWWLPE
jgi:uncharacterized protein YraI